MTVSPIRRLLPHPPRADRGRRTPLGTRGRQGLGSLLTILLLAACGDGGTEVSRGGAAALAVVSGDKQTGFTNASLTEPLVVRVTTSSGAVVAGATVNFTVTSGNATVAPASAVTDLLGLARTQVTLAASPGAVQVQALVANSSVSTTFTATAVAPPVTSCSGAATRTLSIGDVVDVSTSPLCVTAGTATGEYALVVHNGASTFSPSAAVALTPAGLSAPATSVASIAPSAAATFSLSSVAQGTSRTRRDWIAPASERALLRNRLAGARRAYRAGGASYSIAPAVSAAAAVGDIVSLNTNSESGCANIQKRGGRIVAISNRAIIVADTGNPAGGYTTAEYESIANTFDTTIDPVNRLNFGDPSDIDGNGRAILFFTRAVNALTPRNANYYVGGFFYSRDLFPLTTTGGLDGCAGSNQAEMFYLMVPDPNGVVNGNNFAKTFVTSAVIAIVAHEYEHLINASRRMFVNTAATDFEETWLDEGLAHTAEELLFYARTGLTPRKNLDATTLRSSQTYVNLFNDDAVDNFGRLVEFMERPTANSPYAPFDSLATRGAAWSFLRHAADHETRAESATWQAIANSSLTGMANLRQVLGTNLPARFRAWAVSLIADDVAAIPTDYQQPSWSYRTLLPVIVSSNTYPLTTVTWTNDAASNLTLVGGGAAYLRFSIAASQTGRVSWPTLPPNVTVTVARLR